VTDKEKLKEILKFFKSFKQQASSSKQQAQKCAQPVVVLFIIYTTIPSHRPSIMDNPGDVKKFICIKVK